MTGKRPVIVLLLALWFLTTGSSCSVTVDNGNFMSSGSGAVAGVGLVVFLIGGGIYCIANSDECFPDEEALRDKAKVSAASQALFVEGLRLQRAGDPAGLALICVAAQAGATQAQYSYGSQLLRRGPLYRAEAKSWLQMAAVRGNRDADLLLRASGRLRGEKDAAQQDQDISNLGTRPWETVTCPLVGPFQPFKLSDDLAQTTA